ncbi:MAG TPA: hypothetical protein VM328_05475 [Fimbriimonadaceae bacterium]|nr:hypothetical protein [Fimbriimonadaceae bacterium]
MITSTLAAIALLMPVQDAKPISLERVFRKGEKAQYEVLSHLQVQSRQRGLDTWIPEDLDINYKFNYEVTALKADGIAEMRYFRPTMTEIAGETFDSPPKTKIEKVNMDLLLTVSPINEVIAMKDMTPPKKPAPVKPPASKTPPKKGGWASAMGTEAAQINIGSFVGELYRLSLFIGALDSAMDFSPRLPFEEVKPGDTWKRTVGYSPQRLKDKSGKSAVQRLDYEYTYVGVVESNKQKVHRVTAVLKLDTDAAEFVNQLLEMKPEQSGLKEIRLQLDAKIEYDLDLATKRTLRAIANSTGGMKVIVTRFPDDPIAEEKIVGRTSMRLLSLK